MKLKKIDWEVLRHGQEFNRVHIAGFSLTNQISLAGQPPIEEAASTPNSTEVIPLRNRGRPRGKGQRAKGEAEHNEQPPPPKGQLDKEAFIQWKLQLGKNIYSSPAQGWARDNTVATRGPCFQAKNYCIIALFVVVTPFRQQGLNIFRIFFCY